jgi:pilus assembly protein CpaE
MNGCILAIGPVSHPKQILQALHAGADHYLDEADLDNSFQAILPRLQVPEEKSGAAGGGHMLAVLGSSGGSGASTLAVNIACVLAREHEKSVLIDMKLGRGDLASLLDLKPSFSLADLCVNAGRLDRGMFEKMLVRHATGIHLLSSPQAYRDIRSVTPAGVTQAVALARKLFPHVVADVEDCFHEEQVTALRQATGILLISRLDFTSLRNARRILEYLTEVDIPRNRVRLVINRHGQPNELPVDEAEDALGEKLKLFIPDDPKVFNSANNAGIPAVMKFATSRVAQSIVRLAQTSLQPRGDSAVLDTQALRSGVTTKT